LGLGFFCQCAEVFDHFCRAPAVLRDARHCIAHFVEIGLVPVEPAQAGLTIGQNSSQWLVDLMSNGGNQLTHRS
jgi:hypothetical protein